MHIYKNLFIIGSSHISEQSIMQVKDSFKEIVPDFVAIELDERRAASLFERKKPNKFLLLKMLGLPGFIFYIVGELIQKNLGKIVKIEPGSEMKTALLLAKENNKSVVFIDRDIQITLTRFSKFFKVRELIKMVFDLFFGKKEKVEFDLSKVPPEHIIDMALKEVKIRYPSIYKVLIEERDTYMSHRLYALSKIFSDKKILVVVGAGHVNGILENLVKLEKE
jgi:pheromone shutdown-related protein TraB